MRWNEELGHEKSLAPLVSRCNQLIVLEYSIAPLLGIIMHRPQYQASNRGGLVELCNTDQQGEVADPNIHLQQAESMYV